MYINKNLNPKGHKVGDCAIRAVAAACSISWDDAYKGLSEAGFLIKAAMNDIEAVDLFLTTMGFKTGTIKVVKGGHRPTVDEFSREHPDIACVLRVANHLVACAYGNYVDIWDCGDKAVYKYWYKQIN